VIPSRRRSTGRRRKVDATTLLNSLTPTEHALFTLLEGIGRLEQALELPHYFRVVVFGSARVEEGSPEYEDARRLAFELTQRGVNNIVTGGGPGTMEAANRGALECQDRRVYSFGVCIEQLNRNELPNRFLRRAYNHRHFCTRLHQFARLGAAGAFVVMPGGIGTLLEFSMIWQLLQVGHLKGTPLIVIGEMWRELVEWATRNMPPKGYADLEDMGHVHLVQTVEEALPILTAAYENFKIKKARAAG